MRPRRRLALVGLASLALILPAQAGSGENRSNGLFRRALSLFLARNYAAACPLFEEGLRLGQDAEANGRASYYWGECLLQARLNRRAQAAFLASVALAPSSEQGISARAEADRIERRLGPPPLDPAASEQKREPASRAVTAFRWDYRSEPEPGLRSWRADGSGRWHERYPDGREVKVFDQVRRGLVNGCDGVVASQGREPAFEVFIPDRGCTHMWALFRRDRGAWNTMGEMRDIR